MKIVFILLVVQLFICGFTVSAMADTDYKCLGVCVNSKGSSGDCMKECTYNVDRTPAALAKLKKKMAKDPHNQFSKQFVYNTTLPSKRAVSITNQPQSDYQCINGCLKSGMQYQYCQSNCLTQK